ncbi:MAG: hypothetical protein Kow0049_15440 [Stanieria sp.]
MIKFKFFHANFKLNLTSRIELHYGYTGIFCYLSKFELKAMNINLNQQNKIKINK